jgi:hypothetical protein
MHKRAGNMQSQEVIVPILGVRYELEEHLGMLRGDDGELTMSYLDTAGHRLVISSAVPFRYRDQVLALLVAMAAEHEHGRLISQRHRLG